MTDVFSRRIVGWALSDSMRTEALPLLALNQAIVCAKETTGLIHHSDHGSQYVSIVYNERLAEHGIAASTGTVGERGTSKSVRTSSPSFASSSTTVCRDLGQILAK